SLKDVDHNFSPDIVSTHNSSGDENEVLSQEILNLKGKVESAKGNNREIGLIHCFPDESTSKENKPLFPLEVPETILHLRVFSIPKRNAPFVNVHAKTIHIYPNERKAVITTTILAVRAMG
ncbi:hypothetical protein IIA94_02410, partial [Patescibacteria group bacterium]|nr:hypothetical protein [Patescibacteria group bacterium]